MLNLFIIILQHLQNGNEVEQQIILIMFKYLIYLLMEN